MTDLAKGVAASTDAKLTSLAYDVPDFIAKVGRYRPGAVGFNGKTAALQVAKFQRAEPVNLGVAGSDIVGVPVFVLPSNSGSNNDPRRFAKASRESGWRAFGAWLQ